MGKKPFNTHIENWKEQKVNILLHANLQSLINSNNWDYADSKCWARLIWLSGVCGRVNKKGVAWMSGTKKWLLTLFFIAMHTCHLVDPSRFDLNQRWHSSSIKHFELFILPICVPLFTGWLNRIVNNPNNSSWIFWLWSAITECFYQKWTI